MSWHLLEKLLDEVSKQSTFQGKLWITILFVFRIIAITRFADTLYADEQAAFRCNTKQPGCTNVCFNAFSPISHVRFWGFQVIIVAIPPMVFVVYALHVVSRLPKIFKLSGRQIEVTALKRKRKASGSKGKSSRGHLSSRPPATNTTASTVRMRGRSFFASSREVVQSKLRRRPRNALDSGDYYDSSDDSDQDYPPMYNHNGTHYCTEVQLGRIFPRYKSINYQPRSDLESFRSNLSRCDQDRYSSRFVDDAARKTRRFSDSDVSPLIEPSRSSYLGRGCFATSADLPSYDEGSRSHLGAAKKYDWNRTPSSTWNYESRTNKPVWGMQSKSDDDSAFSERFSSSERDIIAAERPDAYKRFSTAVRSSRIVTPQTRAFCKPAKPQVTSFARSDCLASNGRQSSTSTGRIYRRSPASKTSSYNRTHRARATIQLLEDHIAIAYLFQSVIRLLLEVAFLLLQYVLFGFRVPHLYKCSRWPCPHTVDCFISRPSEKSTLLYFMFGVTVLCIALTWHEIVTLSWSRAKESRTKWKSRRAQAKLSRNDSDKMEKKRLKHWNDDPHLFDKYAKYVGSKRKGNASGDSSSDSKTHTSSSESESANEEAVSFKSEDLESMFDNNENVDIGDFAEAAGGDDGNDFV